jgi:hypothetical protein
MHPIAAFALALVTTACAANPEVQSSAPAAEQIAKTPRIAERTSPPAVPVAPHADPGQLLGMQAGSLKLLLGEPNLVRREPPAQVWLYADGGCVFHVYLYEQPGAGGYRVTHYDVLTHARAIRPARDCFSSLLQRAEHRQLDS